MLGLLGGILGSFYPAVRAARQDPVRALREE
jgi:ABC-type lipoprotein release transport system permease subunit